MLKLKRVTAPTVPPVTLTEAKAHLRVDYTDEDTLITSLVGQATRWCEEEAELSFMTQTWRLSLDGFGSEPIMLRRPPVASITSVQYYDTDGVLQVLDAAEYQVDLDAEPALLALAPGSAWPTTEEGRLGAVRITYVAGVATTAALDERARIAVLQLTGHWFEHRESVVTGTIATELEQALTALLRQLWVGVL